MCVNLDRAYDSEVIRRLLEVRRLSSVVSQKDKPTSL
jgi:hypothetical protein